MCDSGLGIMCDRLRVRYHVWQTQG